MDVAGQILTGRPPEGPVPASDCCGRCGEPMGTLPGVPVAALGGQAARRCRRCGTRSIAEAPCRFLFTCRSCGLPFENASLLPHTAQVCPACEEAGVPPDFPEDRVVTATEAEVSAVLSDRWPLVARGDVLGYVNRVLRQVARRMDGAPAFPGVVLVDDARFRTLALPSGRVLMSLGALRFLEDEAEMAFVLAHELAHAASGDAAVRLVRMGLTGVTRGENAPAGDSWAAAAADLVALGYGRLRERDADARALEATLDLGYDPASVLRFLKRLADGGDRGEAILAETLLAHPPARDRVRRMERILYGRVSEGGAIRVNRELFRRAAGPDVLAGPWHRVRLEDEPDLPALPIGGRRWPKVAATVLSIALLTTLIIVAALLLAG